MFIFIIIEIRNDQVAPKFKLLGARGFNRLNGKKWLPVIVIRRSKLASYAGRNLEFRHDLEQVINVSRIYVGLPPSVCHQVNS